MFVFKWKFIFYFKTSATTAYEIFPELSFSSSDLNQLLAKCFQYAWLVNILVSSFFFAN